MKNNKERSIYAGIDISKDSFDVALPCGERYRYLKLANNKQGFKQLLKEIQGTDLICAMEASGPFYLPLASFLHGHGLGVSVVNPLVVRHYAKMRFMRAKTDKKDSATIAAYGFSQQPALWEPEAGHVLALKQLHTVARGLHKSHHQQSRQLESLRAAGQVNRQAEKSLLAVIKQLEAQLEK